MSNKKTQRNAKALKSKKLRVRKANGTEYEVLTSTILDNQSGITEVKKTLTRSKPADCVKHYGF